MHRTHIEAPEMSEKSTPIFIGETIQQRSKGHGKAEFVPMPGKRFTGSKMMIILHPDPHGRGEQPRTDQPEIFIP